MKKNLLILSLFLSQFCLAQQNSISIGYGRLTTDEIVGSFASALGSAFAGGSVENARSTGAISISYHRFNASKRVGFGVSAVYEKLTHDIMNSSGDKISTSTSQAITAAAEGKFKYNKGESLIFMGF